MLRLLARNSGSNISVFVVKLCSAFIMAPVIVRALGNYDYGLWEIVFSVIGYMGMLDIGMRPAVVRYVAKFDAEQDRASLDKLFTSAFLFNGAIGLFCFMTLLGWSFFNPQILYGKTGNAQRYFLFLLIVGIQVFFQFPGYVAECFHEGLQRYVLKNNITIINTIVGNSIAYFLLKNGQGLLTLALVNAGGISAKYVSYLLLLRLEKFGKYTLGLRNFSPEMLKKMLVFGSKTFVQSLGGMITENSAPVIVGFFLGPAVVPFYTIPARLIMYVRQLSMTITGVFMPMFSYLDASKKKVELTQLYLNASRYMTGCMLPIAVTVSVLGKSFISRWIGSEYAVEGATVLYLLGGSYIILFMHPLHQRYLLAIDRMSFLASIRTVSALFYLTLSLVLVHILKKEGVALSLLITRAFFEPLVLQYTCRQLNLSMRLYMKRVLLPVCVPVILLFLLLNWITKHFVLDGYLDLLIVMLSCGFLYLLLSFFMIINREERLYLMQMIRRRVLILLS